MGCSGAFLPRDLLGQAIGDIVTLPSAGCDDIFSSIFILWDILGFHIQDEDVFYADGIVGVPVQLEFSQARSLVVLLCRVVIKAAVADIAVFYKNLLGALTIGQILILGIVSKRERLFSLLGILRLLDKFAMPPY